MRNYTKLMMAVAMLMATGGGLARAEAVAVAEEARCVQLYHDAQTYFFKVMEGLKDEKNSATYGAAAFGSAAYGVCVFKTKSYMGCGVLIGGVGALGTAYAFQAQHRMKQIEDSRRIYELYIDSKEAALDASIEALELFNRVAVAKEDRSSALKRVAGMMESGELCPQGQPVSWDELSEKLAEKLGSAGTTIAPN